MTFGEYARVEHCAPYMLDLHAPSGGRLVYFGSRHSFDLDDPQHRLIEDLWNQLDPTVVFNEGWDPDGPAPSIPPARDRAIATGGESALAAWLAREHGIELLSLEPSRAALIRALCEEFPRQTLKMYFALLSYSSRRQSPESVNANEWIHGVLDYYDQFPCLAGSPTSADELQAAYSALTGNEHDWSTFPSSILDPVLRNEQGLLTNRISARSSLHRDMHMIDQLVGAVQSGERVFVVVGASHVVMQERLLRDRLLNP